MPAQQKAKGKGKKIGRDTQKCAAYVKSGRRHMNKCRNVTKSSGYAAGEKYAKDHGVSRWFDVRFGAGLRLYHDAKAMGVKPGTLERVRRAVSNPQTLADVTNWETNRVPGAQ